MAKQNEIINDELAALHKGNENGDGNTTRKPFVEPTISVPVDVLEATTFFQASTSGMTGPSPSPSP